MLYKSLRYVLQTIIIYLCLRYAPYIALDMMKAGIITIILTVFIISLEFVYNNYATNGLVQQNNENCDVCQLPPIVPDNSPKCRIVCDSDPKPHVENFTGTSEHKQTTHEAKSQEQIDKTAQQKHPNENYYKDTNTQNLGFGGMFYDDYVGSQNTGTYLSDPEMERKRETSEKIAAEKRRRAMEEQATSVNGYSTPFQDPGGKSETRKDIDYNRRIDGEINDDLIYSDYNQLPLAAGYQSADYLYGYSFIPPEKWAGSWTRPPICVSDRRSSVYPSLANGAPTDVKEWYSSNKIMGPNQINTAYINEKLNAGR